MELLTRVRRIGAAHGRDWEEIDDPEQLETELSSLIESRYDEGYKDGEEWGGETQIIPLHKPAA